MSAFAARTARALALLSFALLSGALPSGALTAQDAVTVYRGARVLGTGGDPVDDAVLVVARGRVQSIGPAGAAIPAGARVVDVPGTTITPGLIDAAWDGGLGPNEQNEQGSEVTPAVRVLDGLDPEHPTFQRARRAGVTTVHVMPGTRNVIGGLSAVLKTWAPDPAAMVVREEAVLRATLGAEPSMQNRAIRGGRVESMYYRRPTTRMGVIWEIRRSFYDAQEYMQRTADGGGAGESGDRGLEVLARVLQGTLPLVTTARSQQDLRTALRLAEEFGYTPILDEAQDAHFVVDELQRAGVWVMVGAPSADSVAGMASVDGAEPRFSTLHKLAQANVPFVITTGTNGLALELVREATFACRFGLSRERALAAVTSLPAQLLQIADRVGTLAPGKDADFVVWSADPFDPTSRPLRVVVGGHDPSLEQ
ncbi:MAG: amidohydrolase family protein [Planctomycetota bacterium]